MLPETEKMSWVERIIDASARNRFIVFVLVALLLAGGLYCLRHTPLDAIPDLSDPQVIVYTGWDGRSPDLVEEQVTYPLVTSLLSAPRVKLARGFSYFGASFVYVLFEEGTDIYWARSRVLEYLQALQTRLPQGVTPVLGPDATGVGWAFQYALVDRSGKHDAAALRSFQDWHLRYWLQSVEGVSEVATFGGFEKQYQVELNPHRLTAFGLTVSEVISAIRASNKEVGGRELEQYGSSYIVRGRGYLKGLDDLRQVTLGRGPDGTPIRLEQVAANLTLGPEMRRGAGDLDGQGETPGGIIVVRYGQNVLDVLERVKTRLAEIKPSLPAGVEVVVTYDRSDLIRRAIHTLSRTLVEESVIVALVVILFLLDFGAALRAIITMPIAVILAFIPMYFMGLTANIMSLGGIAIAIGAMVDEAVVMVENVHKKLEHAPAGLDRAARREIIIAACRQLGRPLFFSLLIITVSFLPVFTLQEQEGRLFKPLAFTKTFSMAWAAFLSITIGPALIVLLTSGKIIPESRHLVSRVLQRVYYPWVSALMRRRKLSVTIAVLAVASLFLVYPRLGSEFMPPLNEGTLLYMPTTWPTISITEAKRVLQLQDRLLKKFPEVLTVHGKAGRSDTATDPAPLEMFETVVQLRPEGEWRTVPVRRWYSGWAPEPAQRLLRRVWSDARPITWNELVAEMDRVVRIPGVVNAWTMPIKARIDMLTTGIRTPVGIKIFGPDLAVIGRIGEQVERVLKTVPGTRSAFAERVAQGYYLDITPRRDVLGRYDLNVADVLELVETAIGGMPIERTIEGPERYTVNVRYSRDFRDNPEKLRHVLVPIKPQMSAGSGPESPETERHPSHVPLGELADIRVQAGPSFIKEEDGARTGWVYVDVAGRDIGRYVADARTAVRTQIEDKGLVPAGYRLAWSGQYENMLRARKQLGVILPLTLALIFILLYMNFRSVPATLIILCSIPFAITGSLWILWLLKFNLSVAVWVGIIALAGLAAQTGIVMLVYLEEAFHAYQRAGRMITQHDLFEAITYGAVQRVRPKLMTVCTMLLGLLPLMWAHGAGADVMQRIAAPMIGGLITSSLLTLEIVPAIYSFWRGRQVKWVAGPPRPRPGWEELSERFLAMEKENH